MKYMMKAKSGILKSINMLIYFLNEDENHIMTSASSHNDKCINRKKSLMLHTR